MDHTPLCVPPCKWCPSRGEAAAGLAPAHLAPLHLLYPPPSPLPPTQNVVLYVGSAKDRQVCRETEFYFPPSAGARGGSSRSRVGPAIKFHALLISYETLLKEQSMLQG